MGSGYGVIEYAGGSSLGIVGTLRTPDYLDFLQPLAIVPTQDSAMKNENVAVLVVVARTPSAVAALASTVASLLDADDDSKVKIRTSSVLAELRGVIGDQLADSGRALVLILFASSALLTAFVLLALILMKRKDFGRRRALGATRGSIVGLILIQTTGIALFGSMLGTCSALGYLAASGSALPDASYCAALCICSVFVAIVGSVIPAVVAATREPIRELRVP
jgi:putative ABC transport system permease protein